MPTEHDEKPAGRTVHPPMLAGPPPAPGQRTQSTETSPGREPPAPSVCGDTMTPMADPGSPGRSAAPTAVRTPVPGETGSGSTGASPAEPTRIVFTEDGPALVDGPVELVTADGSVIHADRFLVAICLCKRSRTYPLCDTSHRRRRRGDR